MTALHDIGRWIMVSLAALHVIAIALYRRAWNVRLVGAMLSGSTIAPASLAAPRMRSPWLALIVFALCALAVYGLVEIVPMR
jgi:hypothetical protein